MTENFHIHIYDEKLPYLGCIFLKDENGFLGFSNQLKYKLVEIPAFGLKFHTTSCMMFTCTLMYFILVANQLFTQ